MIAEVYRFVLPIEPPTATHQASARIMRRRDGSPFIGKPSSSAGSRARKFLLLAFRTKRPRVPIEGDVACEIILTWPWLKGDPKRLKESASRVAHQGRSDADNLLKLAADCLAEAGFLTNDRQITDATLRKRRGTFVGIAVRFSRPSPLDDFDLPQNQTPSPCPTGSFASRS